MAARRLLIIMVVLLTISTLAAALVPPPQQRDSSTATTSTTTTTTSEDEPARGGELVREQISIGNSDGAGPTVRVPVGDQLALRVNSDAPGEIGIPAFGLVEFAGPGNPARFDLLLEEAGRYPIRFQGRGTVAEIVSER